MRIGQITEEFLGGGCSFLVDGSIGILEFILLEHVFEEVGCVEGEFCGDGGHGIVRATEEEGHGWVEHFELFVVFGIPSAVELEVV